MLPAVLDPHSRFTTDMTCGLPNIRKLSIINPDPATSSRKRPNTGSNTKPEKKARTEKTAVKEEDIEQEDSNGSIDANTLRFTNLWTQKSSNHHFKYLRFLPSKVIHSEEAFTPDIIIF